MTTSKSTSATSRQIGTGKKATPILSRFSTWGFGVGSRASLWSTIASAVDRLMFSSTRIGTVEDRVATVVANASSHPLDSESDSGLDTVDSDNHAPRSVSDATIDASNRKSVDKEPRKKKGRAVEASLHVQTNLRTLQPKALAIASHLQRLYPSPAIPLNHSSPFQLLCAVVLSAQTTDKKVNECTKELFLRAPDPMSMAALEVKEIEKCIKQLGLAPTKARNLQALSRMLLEKHNGQVPVTFAELEELPGVGHKTASVVMAQVHGKEAFPVDTHIHRLAQRWGLTSGKSVEQTEADLKLLFPSESWRDLHLQIIYFGRDKCTAKSHDPAMCPICSWAAVPPYNKLGGKSPLKAGQRQKVDRSKSKSTKRERFDDVTDTLLSKKAKQGLKEEME